MNTLKVSLYDLFLRMDTTLYKLCQIVLSTSVNSMKNETLHFSINFKGTRKDLDSSRFLGVIA